ncbi:hypothetical protein Scep_022873 [Stephania cephalantha]|uniref:Protein kinase domain-containing protein n=1 Tax=Stephania cephalantha TaxID=152367 RepID=A0AAP0FJ87_9MAGN
MKKGHNFLSNLTKVFKFSKDQSSKEDDLEKIAAQEQKHFPFEVLDAATKHFDIQNKLGEGGFGPVYKGILGDGREIAVKKLSHSSNQGRREFMNEAKLLARVQHRNVVNLLGYCAHTLEKLLVYEYLPNQSLDKFLFRSQRRRELDWKKRYDIVQGLAKGLLYLHEDCHICIIHRDIKASNILLDDKWAPKIADFGMARLFPEDQTQINTRVAGTNGYMAPEYVMHGKLSAKADVFSFGVLVLELISGQKNSTFNQDPDAQSLLEWAWRLYKKGRSLEIMDPTMASEAATDQVEMCIKIGLLCTQADPTLRPTMRRVVVMLSKKQGTIEEPTRPGFPGSRYRRSNRTSAGVHSSSTTAETSTGASSAMTSSSSYISTYNTGSASASTATTTATTVSGAPTPRSLEKRPMQ